MKLGSWMIKRAGLQNLIHDERIIYKLCSLYKLCIVYNYTNYFEVHVALTRNKDLE